MKSLRLANLAWINPRSEQFEQLASDGPLSFLPMEGVWPDQLQMSETTRAEVDTGYTRFEEGDLLLPKIAPTFGHGRSAIARDLLGGVGAGTTELHVLRPKPGVSARWLFYVTKSAPFLQEGEASQYGVAGQKRISFDWLKNFHVPDRSEAEQSELVEFLDVSTAHVDDLISEQQRLLDLTKEHFAAAIDREVWRDVGMTIPLGRLTPQERPIMYGIVLPGPSVEEGVSIVKGGDVKRDRLSPEILAKTTHEIEAPFVRARLRANDIVYAIRGSIGDAELVPLSIEGSNITQDVARIAPGPRANPRWLLYAVRSHRFFSQMESEARGATIRGINIWSLKRGRVPFVGPDVQARVATQIDELAVRMEETMAEVGAQISLLREHRHALITTAVNNGFESLTGAA